MKEIIINADDFGRSHEINLAIVKCFQMGYIQRTTLMVNMPYADEAVELARENGFFDKVGLHLNLGEGQPVNIKTKKTFLCSDEKFNSCVNKRRFPAWRIVINNSDRSIIRDEINSQILKYVEYGFCCKHMDSHRHIHYNMGVLFSVMPLIKKYGFKSIRVRNDDKGGSLIERVAYKLILKKLSIKHADYFFSLREWNGFIDKSMYADKRIELSVHPFLSSDGEIVDSKGIIF